MLKSSAEGRNPKKAKRQSIYLALALEPAAGCWLLSAEPAD
jgi:hypothetical protein